MIDTTQLSVADHKPFYLFCSCMDAHITFGCVYFCLYHVVNE